jgi:D-sedoheptulose 7-phosphate isomerase
MWPYRPRITSGCHTGRYDPAMLEQRIEQHFIDSADLSYQAAQQLGKPLAAAVQAVLVCVTSGGKVLACGNGGCSALAQYFASAFVGRFERERPELAAVALSTDSAMRTAVVGEQGFLAACARQVRALGNPGDVLLVLSPDGQCMNLQAAIAAAHEREMVVVGIVGSGGGRMAQVLRDTDVRIDIPHERAARVLELQLLALHGLCDAVDTQLLGEQEETT